MRNFRKFAKRTGPDQAPRERPNGDPANAQDAGAAAPPSSADAAIEPSHAGRPSQRAPQAYTRAHPSRRAYRILLVDDHPVVRLGLRALLAAQTDIDVCGEATTGPQALEMVRHDKPDLVVLDLTLPEMNGLDVMDAIRQESPSTEILVLTMHFSDELARSVLRGGARGYVLKSDADADLLAAVDQVRHRQPFFTSELAHAMAQSFLESPSSGVSPDSPLTGREVEVVTLLAEGKSNKEAAAELGVSPRTVESHRNHIMKKMEFANFSDLVRFAIRSNLITP